MVLRSKTYIMGAPLLRYALFFCVLFARDARRVFAGSARTRLLFEEK